jgi:large subunit ribosomal protein L10
LETLAKLPSREQLIAQLLGSLNAPATNLASVLAQIPRQLVNVLDAVKRQKELQA